MAFETNNSYWTKTFETRLKGEYQLQDLVSADAHSAMFRTTSQEIVRFFHLSETDAPRQLEIWQSISRTTHPNVLHLVGCGETELDGQSAAYVVSEGADESLVPVLQERSLTKEEAQGLLESLASALNHLHSGGFVHGRVCPAEIFAVGETIKLSSDCCRVIGEMPVAYRSFPAYLAPEQRDQNTTRAADVWCLGASLFEALTQRPFVMERRSDVAKLAAPLNRVIERCLALEPAARPGVKDLVAMLSEPVVQATQPTPPPLPAPERRTLTPVPPPPTEEMPPMFVSSAPARGQNQRSTPVVVAAMAIVLLLIVASVWWAKNRTASAEPPRSADAKTVTQGPVGPPQSVAATHSTTTPETSPAPPPMLPVKPADVANQHQAGPGDRPAAASGTQVWRVILWTYADAGMAQSKADELAKSHPDLHPEVITPVSKRPLHLVVVGGEMTRDEARDMQRKVRQVGLPRDAYIQNFGH